MDGRPEAHRCVAMSQCEERAARGSARGEEQLVHELCRMDERSTRGGALRRVISYTALLLLAACGAGGGDASRGGAGRTALAPADQGSIWYAAFCAECHGDLGSGDGPSGVALSPPPADLRRIAQRDGRFDPDRVAAYIDGRRDVQQHGPRSMPVWGRKRDDRLESALEEDLRLTEQAIAEIVAFLETQQEPLGNR